MNGHSHGDQSVLHCRGVSCHFIRLENTSCTFNSLVKADKREGGGCFDFLVSKIKYNYTSKDCSSSDSPVCREAFRRSVFLNVLQYSCYTYQHTLWSIIDRVFVLKCYPNILVSCMKQYCYLTLNMYVW